MAILKYLCFPILAFCLTGCYDDFDPDVDITPVLCINSLITAGEPVEVEVSRTRMFTDDRPGDTFGVDDAIVSVYANGELKDSSYLPQEGDHISIVAESAKFGRAEAEVTVPVSVPVTSLKATPVITDRLIDDLPGWAMLCDVSFNLMVEMEIADDARSDNYFRLSYSTFLPMGDNYQDESSGSGIPGVSFYCGTFNYELEPIFSEHVDIFESVMGGAATEFTFFTDRQFSGRSYTLHLQFRNGSFYVNSREWEPSYFDCGLEFTLHTVSESYYSCSNYIWQRDEGITGDLSGIGLSDPMWAYSNVSTGAGVVAAQSLRTYTLSLAEFLQSTTRP